MAPSNTASTYFMHLLLPSVDVTPGRLLCRSAPWQVSSEWLSELRASLERTNEFFTSMSEQVGDERFRQIGEHPRPAPATISLPGISKDLDPMGVATDLRLRGPCSQVFHLEPAPAGGGSIGGCKRGAPAEPGLGANLQHNCCGTSHKDNATDCCTSFSNDSHSCKGEPLLLVNPRDVKHDQTGRLFSPPPDALRNTYSMYTPSLLHESETITSNLEDASRNMGFLIPLYFIYTYSDKTPSR